MHLTFLTELIRKLSTSLQYFTLKENCMLPVPSTGKKQQHTFYDIWNREHSQWTFLTLNISSHQQRGYVRKRKIYNFKRPHFSCTSHGFVLFWEVKRKWYIVGEGSEMLFKLIQCDWVQEKEQPFTYYVPHSYLSGTLKQIALSRKYTPSIILYLSQQFYFILHFLAFQRHVCTTRSFREQYNPGSSCILTSNAQ